MEREQRHRSNEQEIVRFKVDQFKVCDILFCLQEKKQGTFYNNGIGDCITLKTRVIYISGMLCSIHTYLWVVKRRFGRLDASYYEKY